ncbi:alpha/beta fold hydrolase [Natronosalvus caseinilyticus]|uniref:alpha/beta fold hydrolase n=1 Tax=Natronosalvus caseinilyticus TaxID=2953747 RepID=UPI0028B11639|nr:alpha/beta hydrolase [Natronosalvus caseinilyticus]
MITQKRRSEGARERLLDDLPVTERRLQLAGVSTAILEGGTGPPIVLLHGPGESALWWMRTIPDLVTTHRVIVPDLPGHGASSVTNNALDADAVKAWLGELIERTCPTPPTLVGHLLGGAIAARFASDHSDRLRGLILVDTFGLSPFRPSPMFAFGLVRFLVRPSDRAYHRFLDQCLVDRDGLIERMGDDWEPFLVYNLERSRASDVKAAMRTMMKEVGVPTVPTADLERITVPTALIWGRNDRAVRLEIASDASARYGWPLRVIDDAGDDPKLEQPEAFLEALYGVLDDWLSIEG